MAEMENMYAHRSMDDDRYTFKGVGGAGLGLGIAGTALGLLNGGLGLFGNNGMMCNNSNYVSKESFELAQKNAALQSELALVKADQASEVKMADIYARLEKQILDLERAQNGKWTDQSVINAQLISGQSVLQSQVGQLMNLTKLVIPNTSCCPGWGDVTVTPVTPTP